MKKRPDHSYEINPRLEEAILIIDGRNYPLLLRNSIRLLLTIGKWKDQTRGLI